MTTKNSTTKLSNKEYLWLLQRLDGKHSIFHRLWLTGKPIFTTQIERAAIAFNEEGHFLAFLLNPEFWETQSDDQKLFIICHECLHVILDHGVRFFGNDRVDATRANYATDIAINHYCVNRLGFEREVIDPENIYCWTDTVFVGEGVEVPPDNMSAEWYYNRIPKPFIKKVEGCSGSNGDDGGGGEGDEQLPVTVDSHGDIEDSDFGDLFDELKDELTDDEKEFINRLVDEQTSDEVNGVQAGTQAGNMSATVDTTPVQKKKKWETVIKKWAMQYLRQSTKEETQWARLNRRFAMLPSDMFLPSDMEIEEIEKDEHRIQVWFFQDTSGSCSGYRQRFFNAAKSLPEDRFDVRLFCFDTQVFETSLESGKLYGFGGTRFDIIERKIQSTIKAEKLEYPKAVFVITDGFGNYVHPAKPEVWSWFLTPTSATYCIPDRSSVYKLKDFE